MLQFFASAIFPLMFISMFFGMQYYILRRMATIFKFNHHKTHYVYLAATTFILPILVIISGILWTVILQIAYLIAVLYLGTTWLLFNLLVILQLAELAFRIPQKFLKALTVSGVIILTAYALVHSLQITIKTVEIASPEIKHETKIAHLTDLHLGLVHGKGFLAKVVEKTNALNPDIVVITGDLIDSEIITIETLRGLNDLKAPTYFVIGNHEIYANLENILAMLKETKVKVLLDEKVLIDDIELIGLKNADYHEEVLAENILKGISAAEGVFTVLLSHQPMPLIYDENINLQLAGHTHGGQIFPFNFFVRLFYSPTKGLHQEGNQYLYVSQGTGTWGPPMRFGSQNEIALITLKPAQ